MSCPLHNLFSKILISRPSLLASSRLYAVKVKGGQASTKKVELPVETDTQILHDYLCGSDPRKENKQEIKLKDDSEYPSWLWELRTGKIPPLKELDPNSKEYHKRVKKLARIHKGRLLSQRGIR